MPSLHDQLAEAVLRAKVKYEVIVSPEKTITKEARVEKRLRALLIEQEKLAAAAAKVESDDLSGKIGANKLELNTLVGDIADKTADIFEKKFPDIKPDLLTTVFENANLQGHLHKDFLKTLIEKSTQNTPRRYIRVALGTALGFPVVTFAATALGMLITDFIASGGTFTAMIAGGVTLGGGPLAGVVGSLPFLGFAIAFGPFIGTLIVAAIFAAAVLVIHAVTTTAWALATTNRVQPDEAANNLAAGYETDVEVESDPINQAMTTFKISEPMKQAMTKFKITADEIHTLAAKNPTNEPRKLREEYVRSLSSAVNRQDALETLVKIAYKDRVGNNGRNELPVEPTASYTTPLENSGKRGTRVVELDNTSNVSQAQAAS